MISNEEALFRLRAQENGCENEEDSQVYNIAIKAIEEQTKKKNSLRGLLEDIERYENDCNITANETCKKCNDTMFDAIRGFIENNFGEVTE